MQQIALLEHMSLQNIAITLWQQDGIVSLMSEFSPSVYWPEYEDCEEVESKVIQNATKLPLPTSLIMKVLHFVKKIGLQIFAWLKFHKYENKFVEKLPRKLIWTPRGTIDKTKTTELLILNENLSSATRYRLACTYCLEEQIFVLWGQLPERIPGREVKESPLTLFWCYQLSGNLNGLNEMKMKYGEDVHITNYEFGFRLSVASINEAATKYFLQFILESEEKERILVRTTSDAIGTLWRGAYTCKTDFPHEYCGDVLHFLLSQLTKEQQTQVLKSHPAVLSNWILYWPWEDFFMDIARRIVNYLSENDYYFFLCKISERISMNATDCTYQNLFIEIWSESSETHKKFVTDNEQYLGDLLWLLFDVRNLNLIKLISKDTDFKVKKKIFYSNAGKGILSNLIFKKNWDLIEFLIQECVASKSEALELKKEYEMKYSFLKDKLKFLEILDDFISNNKFESNEESDEINEDLKLVPEASNLETSKESIFDKFFKRKKR